MIYIYIYIYIYILWSLGVIGREITWCSCGRVGDECSWSLSCEIQCVDINVVMMIDKAIDAML